MSIVKWAAVAVTALMALMNAGAVPGDLSTANKIRVAVVAALALVAIAGFVRRAAWGRPAMVAVGLVNVVAAVIAGVHGGEGWPIGLAVAGLGVLLSAAYRPVTDLTRSQTA